MSAPTPQAAGQEASSEISLCPIGLLLSIPFEESTTFTFFEGGSMLPVLEGLLLRIGSLVLCERVHEYEASGAFQRLHLLVQ
jgi:hypothetical protein